jgi:DNA-binding NtrC family response regulator
MTTPRELAAIREARWQGNVEGLRFAAGRLWNCTDLKQAEERLLSLADVMEAEGSEKTRELFRKMDEEEGK